MFLCPTCTPASARWRHGIFLGLSRGACECCGEFHSCIDYGGQLERHDCAYYRGLQDNCSHVWDGPRIHLGDNASVGTCSKCGASAAPEITQDVPGLSGGAQKANEGAQ